MVGSSVFVLTIYRSKIVLSEKDIGLFSRFQITGGEGLRVGLKLSSANPDGVSKPREEQSLDVVCDWDTEQGCLTVGLMCGGEEEKREDSRGSSCQIRYA